MEEELTCPVCLDLYADPLMLPCSHSVCKSCIQDILTSKQNRPEAEQKVECPSCRQDCGITLNTLPRNLALENVVFRYQEEFSKKLAKNPKSPGPSDEQRPTHNSSGFPEEHSHLCELCEGGATCKAAWYCDQCNVSYCHPCLDKYHPKRGSLMRHHIRQPSGDREPDHVQFCGDHVTETTSIYCWQCKAMVCHLCVCETVGKHVRHKVLETGAAQGKIKDIFSQYKEDIDALKASHIEHQSKLEEMELEEKTLYDESCERVHYQYRQLVADVVNVLDLQKQQTLSRLASMHEDSSKSVAVQKKESQACSIKLATLQNDCQLSGNDCEAQATINRGRHISSVDKEIKKDLKQLKQLETEFQHLAKERNKTNHRLQSGARVFETKATECLKILLDADGGECVPVIPHIQSPSGSRSPTTKPDTPRVQNKYLITWGFTSTTFTAEQLHQNSTWSVTIERNTAGHYGNVNNGYLFGVGIATSVLNFKDNVGRNDRSVGVICENGHLYYCGGGSSKQEVMPLGALPISVSISTTVKGPDYFILTYKISCSTWGEVLIGKKRITDPERVKSLFPVFTVSQRVKMVFPTFV